MYSTHCEISRNFAYLRMWGIASILLTVHTHTSLSKILPTHTPGFQMKRNFSQFSFFTMTSPFPRLPVACGTARQSPSGIAPPTAGYLHRARPELAHGGPLATQDATATNARRGQAPQRIPRSVVPVAAAACQPSKKKFTTPTRRVLGFH